MIIDIGKWLLQKACQQLVDWQIWYERKLELSINLSMKQFALPDLVDYILETVASFQLSSESIKFEITETFLLHDADSIAKTLGKLREAGFRIYIDDFGTGYSSLSYLHQLPLDALKIDKSFISGSSNVKTDIVKAIISVAQSLQLEVIAEGVETLEQLHYLQGLDCDAVQGFLFTQPLPAAQAQQLIRQPLFKLPRVS